METSHPVKALISDLETIIDNLKGPIPPIYRTPEILASVIAASLDEVVARYYALSDDDTDQKAA